MTDTLEQRLETIVRGSESLMTVLRLTRELDLPDWLIVSGAVYQKVWNHLTGRDPDYGIKDYDLAYHDASDTTYEGEDVHIKRAAAHYPPPFDEQVARPAVAFERQLAGRACCPHAGQRPQPCDRVADIARRLVVVVSIRNRDLE